MRIKLQVPFSMAVQGLNNGNAAPDCCFETDSPFGLPGGFKNLGAMIGQKGLVGRNNVLA